MLQQLVQLPVGFKYVTQGRAIRVDVSSHVSSTFQEVSSVDDGFYMNDLPPQIPSILLSFLGRSVLLRICLLTDFTLFASQA